MSFYKKNLFKKGKKAELEKIIPIRVEKNPSMEELIARHNSLNSIEYFDHYTNEVKHIDIVLKPKEINYFFQQLISNDEVNQRHTGIFLTKLIKNSHEAGHNEFVLHTQDIELNNLLSDYCANVNEGKKLQMTIEGNIGSRFADYAQNINATINGNTNDTCGHGLKNSLIVVNGNVLNHCAKESEFSEFEFNGNVGNYCGYAAKSSIITLTSKIGIDLGNNSKNCTFNLNSIYDTDDRYRLENPIFKTKDPKVYMSLLKSFNDKSAEIKLVSKAGTILMENNK